MAPLRRDDAAGLSNNLSAPKSIQKIGSWYHVNPI